ncbi:cyclic AMP-dependent transcription factor ATF-1-like isoform X2 [Limulus polyphemus]|uniref:Cyclic AMP-dependent transcription factor ATF-1-like isoform X2 n=1 Tax=Limulus polyphemus TaxID=6850 RepID=A0ABM1B5W6_LIMPO|nr:cyclic AMP-dependent transcription factor ATF-1-like isoform X2 [Limulus polyphemus]
MDTLVEEQNSAGITSSQPTMERATASPIQPVVCSGGGRPAGVVSASSLAPGTQVRSNGTILLMSRASEKNVVTTVSSTTQAIAVPQPGGAVSIVHVSIPSGTQPMYVQSVIQPNQQSVIQAPGGTGLQSFGKNVILLNKGSVIHSTEGDGGVHPVQLITTTTKGDGSEGDGITLALGTGEDESRKRREILARRPSYRKILNELSSTEPQGPMISLGVGSSVEVKEESGTGGDSSSQESDNSNAMASNTITVAGTQYHTAQVVPASAIQLATGSQDSSLQGLQTLTMTNAGTAATGTIVQYAQGQDGQQFLVPVTLSATDLQAYQIRTAGMTTNTGLPQSVVMTPATTIQNPQQLAEETSRRRELRLLKNREAAKECRRKKKEYIKCLENRVAVLENQNKALIEELKSLKELYCQKNE